MVYSSTYCLVRISPLQQNNCIFIFLCVCMATHRGYNTKKISIFHTLHCIGRAKVFCTKIIDRPEIFVILIFFLAFSHFELGREKYRESSRSIYDDSKNS